MEEFEHISVEKTFELLSAKKAKYVDIRDEQSFEQAHVEDSFHLTNGSLQQFMSNTEFDMPIIVGCYHGISSQQAAQFLIHQGFDEVYSMDGGFEAWRTNYPVVSSIENNE